MGPAIALRLRQHLTLTPQVQQALRLLQMSALEFAQEMEQALTENPFLEEKDTPVEGEANVEAGEAPVEAPVTEPTPSLDDLSPAPGAAPEPDRLGPRAESGSSNNDREQDEWSGNTDATPSLQEHLRSQLM